MTCSARLLDSFLWLRRLPGLARIYRLCPRSLRAMVSSLAWRQLERQVRFPSLPSPESALLSPGASVDVPNDPVLNGEYSTPVNVYGFLGGQFGLGECARLYVRALEACGVPVTARDVDLALPHAWAAFEHPAMRRPTFAHGCDVVIINPDYFELALPRIRPPGEVTRPLIGVWFWELGALPESWIPALGAVDAIVVASRFVQEAFKRRTSKPVLRVPIPISELADSGASRGDFGLPDGVFLFLTSFDFHSSIHRKNPHAVIAAFREAFPSSRSDVGLVVKSVNGHRHPEALAALLALAADDHRILVRDATLSAQHLGALQRCCDAYVSLHRAEGFGLGLAECMAREKAVVATAWSGNLDFMSDEVACLVSFELVPVEQAHYPGAQGSVWAEPDVIQAASYMRALADDPAAAHALGRRAARHVRQVLSPAGVADTFMRALEGTEELRTGSGRQ